MVDESFYKEAIEEIKHEAQWTKELCKKYGVAPDYVKGHINGLERALQILQAPIMSLDEGYK